MELFETEGVKIAVEKWGSSPDRDKGEAALRLVRALAGNDAGIEHRADGAPLLTGAEGFISISHCAEGIAVALRQRKPVGIDYETPRPRQLRAVAERLLSTDEMEAYSTDTESLLRAWTAKEAVYKCALTPGLGLQEIRLDGTTATARGCRYLIFYRATEGALIAVAL